MGDDLTPLFGCPPTDTPLPPPVPPRVPSAVPPAPPPPEPPGDPAAPPAASFRIDTRRFRRAAPRSDGGTGAVLSLLVVAAAGTLAYVAWPKLAAHLAPRSAAARKDHVAPPESPEPPVPVGSRDVRPPPPAARVESTPAARRDSPAADRPRRGEPAEAASAAVPFPPDATVAGLDPPAATSDPAPDPGRIRASVDAAIRAAALALRRGDLAAAGERLAAAEAAAGDDAESHERTAAWRRLLLYAEGFGPLRDRALAASVGNEYTVDGKLISIVEVNDDVFVYRRLGRNVRIARDRIPRAIIVDIVTAWFRNAKRPANELFLGAYHVCREPPNVERARAAWERAGRGGEADADLLLRLLDDPALVAPAP